MICLARRGLDVERRRLCDSAMAEAVSVSVEGFLLFEGTYCFSRSPDDTC